MKVLHQKANVILGYISKAYCIQDTGVPFHILSIHKVSERLSSCWDWKKVTNGTGNAKCMGLNEEG